MRLATRFIRLLRADVHGYIDQFENKQSLIRHHLQEMQQSLLAKEKQLKTLTQMCRSIQSELAVHAEKAQCIDSEIAMAIEKGSDSIARSLIRDQMAYRRLCRPLQERYEQLVEEHVTLAVLFENQRGRYDMIKSKAAHYLKPDTQVAAEQPTSCASGEPHYQISDEHEVELELLRHNELQSRRDQA